MARLVIIIIRTYQIFLSPVLGPRCRFYPSCSSYAITAYQRFGLIKGSYLAIRRILRCHPGSEGGLDPVPEANNCNHQHH